MRSFYTLLEAAAGEADTFYHRGFQEKWKRAQLEALHRLIYEEFQDALAGKADALPRSEQAQAAHGPAFVAASPLRAGDVCYVSGYGAPAPSPATVLCECSVCGVRGFGQIGDESRHGEALFTRCKRVGSCFGGGYWKAITARPSLPLWLASARPVKRERSEVVK